MANDNYIKGVLVVSAALLMNLISGINYNLPSISQYMASYLHYNNNEGVTIKDCFFLMPIGVFCTNLTAGLGGYIEGKYSARVSVFFGVIMMSLGYSSIYLFPNILVIYFSVALAGAGIGLCYLSPLRLAWKYFPNKKGLLTGIIMTGFGFSATIFNFISDSIINPNDEKVQEDSFYSPEIANKLPSYIFIIVIIFVSVGVIVVTLLFPFEENKNESDRKIEYLVESDSINDISIHDYTEENLEVRDKEPFIIAFKSSRLWIICFMSFSYVFYPFMFMNVVRPFGNLTLDPKFMSLLMIFIPISNALSRIFWGFLYDFIAFKKLYLFQILVGIFISATLGYISDIKIAYFVYSMISANLLGGNFVLLPPLVTKIFGMKNASELYGVVCLFCGLSCLSGPIITEFIIRENVKKDYLILFWIGTCLFVLALILCLLLKEEKFNYDRGNKKNKILNLNPENEDENRKRINDF